MKLMIKMCGFTRPEDSAFASRIGADMVGVILVRGSPRCVSLQQAADVLSAAGSGTMRVAVAMPDDMRDVERIGRVLKPDFIQLHHAIKPEFIEEIVKKTGFRVIGTVAVPREGAKFSGLLEKARRISDVCDVVLIDTKGPHGGGTGLTHDWSMSSRIRKEVKKQVFLAGGLTPENVREAIRAVSPDGVDVATGIESSPGIKNRELMRKFVEAVRGA